jgi:hypothetical protein
LVRFGGPPGLREQKTCGCRARGGGGMDASPKDCTPILILGSTDSLEYDVCNHLLYTTSLTLMCI